MHFSLRKSIKVSLPPLKLILSYVRVGSVSEEEVSCVGRGAAPRYPTGFEFAECL